MVSSKSDQAPGRPIVEKTELLQKIRSVYFLNKNRGLDSRECDVSVDHLYKWAMREVELWALKVAPRPPGDKKKYHVAKREHHHVSFLYHQREIPSGYLALG
jgi:hypothetical protein